jgi:Mg2+/Co2+ transporter CorB
MSAYFSGTETALTALSEIKTAVLQEKWSFISPTLKKWTHNPGMILSSLLIGNNVVNILGALLAGKVTYYFLSTYPAPVADFSAVAVMTVFVLIFGEVTPKTFAKVNPEKWVVPALIIFRFFEWMLIPFAYFCQNLQLLLLKSWVGKAPGADLPRLT